MSSGWNAASRIGFGLRALSSNSATYSVKTIEPNIVELIVPTYIPIEERTVLRAVGETRGIPDESRMSAVMPERVWPGIETMLANLGLRPRNLH